MTRVHDVKIISEGLQRTSGNLHKLVLSIWRLIFVWVVLLTKSLVGSSNILIRS